MFFVGVPFIFIYFPLGGVTTTIRKLAYCKQTCYYSIEKQADIK
jgi:hypothetical protein